MKTTIKYIRKNNVRSNSFNPIHGDGDLLSYSTPIDGDGDLLLK